MASSPPDKKRLDYDDINCRVGVYLLPLVLRHNHQENPTNALRCLLTPPLIRLVSHW
jgi:hypothetical protein